MPKTGKKFAAASKQVEAKPYSLNDAVPLVQKIKFAKFDETVELHMRLGVDPKHADQMVRGTVVLPNGLGKSKKVLVIASGDKIKEGQAPGWVCSNAKIRRELGFKPQVDIRAGIHRAVRFYRSAGWLKP